MESRRVVVLVLSLGLIPWWRVRSFPSVWPPVSMVHHSAGMMVGRADAQGVHVLK